MIDSETMTGLLRVLQSCGGIPVRESVIFGQYNASATTVQTMAAIREHLQHAKDKGWADYIVDEIDRARKWFITAEGKALLSSR
jgi:hypothetical protein